MFRFTFSFFLFVSLLLANMNEAKKAYSIGDYERAVQLFEKAFLENPETGEPYFFIGQIYELQKEFDKSIEMFEKALNLELNEDKQIRSYIKIIRYYERFAAWQKVFDYSFRLLQIQPQLTYIEQLKNLAEENLKNQAILPVETKDPILSLNQSLLEQPDNLEIHWQLALRYYNKNDLNNSLYHLSVLLQKEPNNPSYLYKQGIIYSKLNQTLKAIDSLKKVVQFTDTSNFKLLYYTYINLGNLYFKINDYQNSVKSYRNAYSNVKNSQSLLGIVKVKYTVGDCVNAIRTAKKARKYNKHTLDFNVYQTLCLVKRNKKKFVNLENLAQQILNEYEKTQIPQKYYPVFYELGFFYYKQKNHILSQKYFDILPYEYHFQKDNFYYQAVNFYETKQWRKSLDYFLKVKQSSYELYYYLIRIYTQLNQLVDVKFYIKKASEFNDEIWKKIQEDSFFNQIMADNLQFQYYIVNRGKEMFELKTFNTSKTPKPTILNTPKQNLTKKPIPSFQTPVPNSNLPQEQKLQEPKSDTPKQNLTKKPIPSFQTPLPNLSLPQEQKLQKPKNDAPKENLTKKPIPSFQTPVPNSNLPQEQKLQKPNSENQN